jgi:cell division control protein 42
MLRKVANCVNLVVVGDDTVGKTSLLHTYKRGEFPTGFVPPMYDSYIVKVMVDQTEFRLQFWDPVRREELLYMQATTNPKTRVFLVCFSVSDRASFDNVASKWVKELAKVMTDPVILLVGTKTDARDVSSECVSVDEGKALALKIGAFGYAECAAIRIQGVKGVFDRAIVRGAQMNRVSRWRCNVQ